MKYRYTKYTGDLMDEIDLEDLVSKLSDLLLSSGFNNPWDPSDTDEDRTMQALHDAIMDALFNGGVLPEDALERLLGDPADADQAVEHGLCHVEHPRGTWLVAHLGHHDLPPRPATSKNV